MDADAWWECDVRVGIYRGLHCRPSAILARHCRQYDHQVELVYEGRAADAKLSMSILSLGADEGSRVRVRVSTDHPRYEEAGASIARLLQDAGRSLVFEEYDYQHWVGE